MRINWKRFSIGAFLLASLSLLLFGCSDLGSSQKTPAATKSLSGVVSGSDGLRLANAKVTAYAVSPSGVVSTTPLSTYSVNTDINGAYTLQIPAGYTGNVEVLAQPSSLAKVAFAAAVNNPVRSITSITDPNAVIPQTMVSMATEITYLYASQLGGGFDASLKKATIVLEAFFGPGYTQIPPPTSATDSNATKAQQDLNVFIKALSSTVDNSGNGIVADFVSGLQTGMGALSTAIETAINNVVSLEKASGMLPSSYSTPASAATESARSNPPTLPDLSDVTPPTAPGNLTAAVVNSQNVTITWVASQDNAGGGGVAGYLISRADATGVYQAIATAGAAATSFSDTNAASQTSYSYKVVAYDQARNLSAASISNQISTPIATYTISGTITLDGVGQSGVQVSIGSGTPATTDASGNYSIQGVAPGTYTLTPTFFNYYTFTPNTLTVTVGNANVGGQNFVSVFSGTIIGGVAYPDGTIVGGVTYPTGVVIGGVFYPTATVIGGVTYPTGVVIGGVTYPNGVVIGGVSYPAGTVVGGVAFPVGAVTTGVTYPSGVVIGGVIYPTGTVIGGVIYPTGTVTGGTNYPNGTVIGAIGYPSGVVTGGSTYPTGIVQGGAIFPTGGVLSGVIYPVGGVSSGTSYGVGIVSGSIDWRYLISGKVTDHSGVALSGVAVTVPGFAYATTTDTLGNYRLFVQAGTYTVRAALASYTFTDSASILIDGTATHSQGSANFTAQ